MQLGRSRATWISLSVLVLMVGTPGARADHATVAGQAAGAFVPWGFNDGWFGCDSNPTCHNDEIALAGQIQPDEPAGMATARFKIPWQVIQPTSPAEFDWTLPTAVYNAMQAEDMVPVMELTGSPAWARVPPGGGPPVPNSVAGPPQPTHYDDYRAFVEAAVERFVDVAAVEIWNEPNHPSHFTHHDDPDTYVELLQQARLAIDNADVHPPILFGGLAPGGSAAFLRDVYESDAVPDPAATFDGIGIHPYVSEPSGLPAPPPAHYRNKMWDWLELIEAVRDEEDPGSDACLWITEMGVGARWGGYLNLSAPTEAQQGPILTDQLYASLYDHCIGSFIVHNFTYKDGAGGWFGSMFVWRPEILGGGPRPAYCNLGQQIGETVC